MLKEKRFERNSTIACICVFVFIIALIACFCCEYVDIYIDNVTAKGQMITDEWYNGFTIMERAAMRSYLQPGKTEPGINYDNCNLFVTAYSNIIILVIAGCMLAGTCGGLFSTQQEALKRAIVFINVCFSLLIILSCISAGWLIVKFYYEFGGGNPVAVQDTFKATYGAAPFVLIGVTVICYIVFRIFAKKAGYKFK
ncbi:MAG: hypothetical protein J6B16_02255 [Clostridia bacterium]|nr:hypothetical protein [Clostridia bacterium]